MDNGFVTSNSDNSPALAPLTLVLGGARSGKSTYAERLIEAAGGGVYLATAQALDGEMQDRIRLHRVRRGEMWRTVEEPIDLGGALKTAAATDAGAILVDCLTLWLSNLMAASRDIESETDALISMLPEIETPVVMVSNEVGLGIVPDNALARAFRDEAGRMNQRLAEVADRVIFIAAGLPLIMKG